MPKPKPPKKTDAIPRREPTPEELAEWRIGALGPGRRLCLNLKGFGLTTVPQSIRNLRKHEEIDLSGNLLTVLPDAFRELTQLRRLYVNGNRLRTLPESFSELTRLNTLDLSSNELTDLPEWLSKLPNLRHLFLHGNHALGIPAEILGPTRLAVEDSRRDPRIAQIKPARASDVLSYYFQTRRAARPLNEIKLILVGRGGAGKSSIRDRLIEDTFEATKRETSGIDIRSWTLNCENLPLHIRVWDFAGQEITHATHQFFLTERSVYVLTLDARADTQDRDAEYWLRLITAFGKESPVIVALNKFDEKPFAIDERALRERFPAIQAFIPTDCKSGRGIRDLKEAIISIARVSKEFHQTFPLEWWALKERFAELKENYLSFSTFRTICSQHGVDKSEDQERLARTLHALGIILHYADDSRLRDTTILNPHWVTNGVYKLLRLKDHPTSLGTLTLIEAQAALPHEPRDMVLYLLGIMRRFELCYALDKLDRVWLVPQLLPRFQPKLGNEWKTKDATRLRYRYSVLPEGLLPRFIVRTNPLSVGQVRWRNGVVLLLGTASALVRAEPVESYVTVVAIGEPESRLRLLKLIRGHFSQIHGQLHGLCPREELEVEGYEGVYKNVDVLEHDERKHRTTTIETSEGSVVIAQSQQLDRISTSSARSADRPQVKLFVSYAHKDAHLFELFRQHLEILKMDGVLQWWSDRDVQADMDWDQEIRRELDEADIIVLLVSTAFLASPYLRSAEFAKAVERRKFGKVEIVSVILEKDCAWKQKRIATFPGKSRVEINLASYHAVLPAGKAVRGWARYGNAFGVVEERLRELVAHVQKRHK